jgi:hypothetical protein
MPDTIKIPHPNSLKPQNQPDFRGTEEERFWPRVNKEGGIPAYNPQLGHCWVWTAGKDNNGYGRFHLRQSNRTAYAHIWAYKKIVGEIPDGLELDHLCRNPSCCNPKHLEPVTHYENFIRGESPLVKNAIKTHCKRGHIFDEKNTRIGKHGERICRPCMKAHMRAFRKGEKLHG